MIKVIGAGLGRTGTMSLKLALEHLLGHPCYHMADVLAHPEHIPFWQAAARGDSVDWSTFFADYAATVDWPSTPFWLELSTLYPNALILLSYRDADAWWQSASKTIFPRIQNAEGAWRVMMDELLTNSFTAELANRSACIDAFNRHNESVRNAGLGSRLLVWQPGDGWEPLCQALSLDVPDVPFPHANSRAAYLEKRRSESTIK
ncbi:MAG: sulfotransferase family protein [Chloroflexota bacterium]